MPEHLRSLIVILTIAFGVFSFFLKALVPVVSDMELKSWRNNWLAITIIAFVASNFWIYVISSFAFLLYSGPKQKNPLALYLLLITALPPIDADIPGFGLVNFLFSIHHYRILALAILFPIYLRLKKQADTPKFGKLLLDKVLFAYLLLIVALNLRDATITDTIRYMFYQLIDIFLPYYITSRAIKNMAQVKELIIAFVIGCAVMAVIGCFEFITHWLLYNNLNGALGTDWSFGSYLGRGEFLRALGALGQPIILGFLMVIALGLYFFVAESIKSKTLRYFGYALMLAGLFAPLSRGPWMGAIVLIIVFLATGSQKFKRFAVLIALIFTLIPTLSVIPGGHKIIDLLPFVGHTESQNIDYRSDLLTNSAIVFERHLLLGSNNYVEELAELGMTQGQGIVDIVNSYVWIALKHGLIGLILFVSFFLVLLNTIYSAMRKVEDKNSESYLLGRALLSCLSATMVIIFTVSNILIIPFVYMLIAGIDITYSRLSSELSSNKVPVPLPTSRLRAEAVSPYEYFAHTISNFSHTLSKIKGILPTSLVRNETTSLHQKSANSLSKINKSLPSLRRIREIKRTHQHFANTLTEVEGNLRNAVTIAEDFGLATARAKAHYAQSQTIAYKKALAAKVAAESILNNASVNENTKAHARKILAMTNEVLDNRLQDMRRNHNKGVTPTMPVKDNIEDQEVDQNIKALDMDQSLLESDLRTAITITEGFSQAVSVAKDHYAQSQNIAYSKAVSAKSAAERILNTPNISADIKAHAQKIISKANAILNADLHDASQSNNNPITFDTLYANTHVTPKTYLAGPILGTSSSYQKAIAAKLLAVRILSTPCMSAERKANARKMLVKVNGLILSLEQKLTQ